MKKTILFVDGHVFDGEFQGTRTYVKEIYLELLRLCPDIFVYFGANNIESVKNIFLGYENVGYVKYESNGSLERIFFEIPKIIKKLSCTHAHFQYVIPFTKVANCNYIVTIHDILFNDFPREFSLFYRLKRNLLFFFSAKFSSRLFTVSEYSKKRISQSYRVDEKSIGLTLNGVSQDFFDFSFSKEESRKFIYDNYLINKYIIYVSRIEPRKNQMLLLDIYLQEKLWQRGYSLVFIGNDTLASDFESQLKKINQSVSDNIKWIRQVDYYDLKHFLNGAEVFVYPSKAEGFGIPPLEAAAMLTPVLCSNVTAMEDFSFFYPYTFNPEDKEDFREKLVNIIDHIDNVDVLNIKNSIKNKYSWKESAQIILDELYK